MNIVNKTKDYYLGNNDKNGKGSPLNLWVTPERQLKRFEQIVKVINLNNRDILDVGCGYGDFYNWLMNQGITPNSYIGIDLLEEHCEIALSNLPKSCSIICGDFLQAEIHNTEFCILSGTLNFHGQGWLELAHKILDKMWNISTIGMIFNLRSPYSIKGNYPEINTQIEEL